MGELLKRFGCGKEHNFIRTGTESVSFRKHQNKTISWTDNTVEAVSKVVKVFTEQDHLQKVDFEN